MKCVLFNFIKYYAGCDGCALTLDNVESRVSDIHMMTNICINYGVLLPNIVNILCKTRDICME